MTLLCVSCDQPIEAGDYRLVGVENGSWESRYAHRGTCETEARARFARPAPKKRSGVRKKREEAIEELTVDEGGDYVDDSAPWTGMQRRE